MIELADPEAVLLRETADPGCTRKDVALTYAFALRGTRKPDWATVNEAIVARWSKSGLHWVKALAWAYVEGRKQP